jgi:hypothetical protein
MRPRPKRRQHRAPSSMNRRQTRPRNERPLFFGAAG